MFACRSVLVDFINVVRDHFQLRIVLKTAQ
jgi:hypothetical protein